AAPHRPRDHADGRRDVHAGHVGGYVDADHGLQRAGDRKPRCRTRRMKRQYIPCSSLNLLPAWYDRAMWNDYSPYTQDELQEMRRLIVASGSDVPAWVQLTRRSAEFVRSLSPAQADIITAQALAVAIEPDDLGSTEGLVAAAALFAGVAPE